jgi:outer membrane protein, heavy metal efflux system
VHIRSTIKIAILAAGVCCAAAAAPAQETPPVQITLAQALKQAEEQNPALRAARLELRAAENRRAQAALRQNPGFSVEAENFAGRDDLHGFDGTEYTAQLEQSIELGGKRARRVGVAEAARKLTEFNVAAKSLDVRAETSRRFVALQGAQERIRLSKESTELAEAFLSAVAARVLSGKVSPMDEDKARILLTQQRTAMEAARRELQAARMRLSAMWGCPKPDFETAQGDMQTIGELPELPALMSRMTANPDLARWAVERDQRSAVLTQEKAARLPDVTLAAGVRWFAETESEAFVAGLSIPLPLLNRNQGGVGEAAALLEKVEQERLAAEADAVTALTGSYEALAAARNRMRALNEEVIPRSKAVLDAVQKGYTEGKFTYLDVLDARRTFFEARGECVEALVAGHEARAEVERLVGQSLGGLEEK